MAASVAVVAVLAWPLRFGPVGVAPGATARVVAPVSLGQTTTMAGDGLAHVQRADREATIVEVLDGELSFEVDPEGRYRNVRVISDDIEVRVRGTKFTVSDLPSVSVERGHVEVYRNGERIANLNAGERWRVPQPVVEPPPVAVRAPRIEPRGWKPRVTPRAPVHAVLALPPHSEPRVPPSIAPRAPKRAVPRASAAVAFAEVLSRGERGRDAAVLAADWSIFLGTYPDAPEGLESEARVRRLQAQLDSSTPADAVIAVDEFLRQHPDHARRSELQFAKATLLRGDLEDCGQAVPAYRIAAEAGGDMGARSEVFLGVCLLHLGQPLEAIEAIDRARELGIPEDVERYATRVVRRASTPR